MVHGGRGSQEASLCSTTERAAARGTARWARLAKAMPRHGLCGAVGVTSPASWVGGVGPHARGPFGDVGLWSPCGPLSGPGQR